MPASPAPTVLVTGATSGIGQAIARGFAAAGDAVLAVGMGPLPEAEPGLTYASLDVRDDAAVAAALAPLGALRAVVNAAGVINRGSELTPEGFAATIDVNLNGTMRVCAAARPALAARAGGGAIVNIASMLSFFGSPVAPGYAASKGGVVQLTKSLALAYAPDGIRVNALAPGWIATAMTGPLRDEGSERGEAILARTPLARWGAPDDLAGPALFLASPQSGFVTGSVLNVDGGYAAA
ncbi:MAG: SDR family oxidoreductase [Pseudomonadota bacterium]